MIGQTQGYVDHTKPLSPFSSHSTAETTDRIRHAGILTPLSWRRCVPVAGHPTEYKEDNPDVVYSES